MSAPDSVDRNLSKLQEMVQDKGAELVCCSPSGYRESGMTEQLSNNDSSDPSTFLSPNVMHCGLLRQEGSFLYYPCPPELRAQPDA